MNKHAEVQEKDSYIDLLTTGMRYGFCVEFLMDNSQHPLEHV